MPFYLRKTVRAGPFRFNLSNSGVGVSVGIKGLRIGTGPRGHYVHAGRGGLYYRASLGGVRHSSAPRRVTPAPRRPMGYVEQSSVTMIDVQSGDVAAMHDATVDDFVNDLNKKQARIPLGITAAGCLALIGTLALLQSDASGQSASAIVGSAALLAALPAWAIGKWFDSYKRTSVLFYKLEETAETAYRKMAASFDSLAACQGKWHIASGGAVQDIMTWKRNAGAAHLVNRKIARLAYTLPKVLRSNITPPTITLGGRTFYFLPDTMLVKHEGRFGAVGYDDLQIASQSSYFIEDGTQPADAQVVDHTWLHPNKSGGPDRRFRDNRQLPVCLYDVMHLSSSSGVNELMEFSRTGLVQPFSTALHDLPRRPAPGGINDVIRLDHAEASEKVHARDPESPRRQLLGWKSMVGAAALIAAGGIVAAHVLHGGSRVGTAPHGSPGEQVSASITDGTQSAASLIEGPVQEPSNASVQPLTPSLPVVTVKTTANLRSGPSTSATIIRVAQQGEKFEVFGRANGWVQVGTERPLGWIAASLLTTQ